MEKGRLALLLSAVTILVGSLIFLKWVLVGRQLPREAFRETKLRILSYSTFVSSTGPAPQLAQKFKEMCQCEVEFYTAGDAGLLLERLKLTQNSARFDLVIGMDQFYAGKALKEWEWLDPKISPSVRETLLDFVKHPDSDKMIPVDRAVMTFIYRKADVAHPPASLEELLDPRFRSSLSLQDPRSSSPGLQFLSWVIRIYGEDGARKFLKNLQPNIHSVSPSWALSYGLFKKKQSQFVFSYATSLAYHLGVEQDDSYAVASFKEGHPLQVEYAGIPKGCIQCDLAAKFVEFLLQPEAQKTIVTKNFMQSVLKDFSEPEEFKKIPPLKTLPVETTMPNMEIWDQAFD